MYTSQQGFPQFVFTHGYSLIYKASINNLLNINKAISNNFV